jgi:hypothetical protein
MAYGSFAALALWLMAVFLQSSSLPYAMRKKDFTAFHPGDFFFFQARQVGLSGRSPTLAGSQ